MFIEIKLNKEQFNMIAAPADFPWCNIQVYINLKPWQHQNEVDILDLSIFSWDFLCGLLLFVTNVTLRNYIPREIMTEPISSSFGD